MGAQLPTARYSGPGHLPAAQAARQPTTERDQVLLYGGCFGTSQRSVVADEGDQYYKPTLAAPERS